MRPIERLLGPVAISAVLCVLYPSCANQDHPAYLKAAQSKGGRAGTGGSDSDVSDAAVGGVTNQLATELGIVDTGSMFDPDEVYFVGGLYMSSSTLLFDCLFMANVAAPDSITMTPPTGALRFFGNELFYQGSAVKSDDYAVSQFAPEQTLAFPTAAMECPVDPQANDSVVVTSRCPRDEYGTGPMAFVTSPDGAFAYWCRGDGLWYANGEVLYDGYESVLAMGYDHLLLVSVSSTVTGSLISIPHVVRPWSKSDAELHVAAIPRDIRALRATTDGFYVAAVSANTSDLGLWHLFADGHADNLGSYPSYPEGISEKNATPFALARDGAVFSVGKHPAGYGYVIVKRMIDGTSEIAYPANYDPATSVAVGFWDLITGP